MNLRHFWTLALAAGTLLVLTPAGYGQDSIRQIQRRNLEQHERQLVSWDRELETISRDFNQVAGDRAKLATLTQELESLTRTAVGLRSKAGVQLDTCKRQLRAFDKAETVFYEARFKAASATDAAAASVASELRQMQNAFDAAVAAKDVLQEINGQLAELSSDKESHGRAAAVERELLEVSGRLRGMADRAGGEWTAVGRIRAGLTRVAVQLDELLHGLQASRRAATESHEQAELDGLIVRARNRIVEANSLKEVADQVKKNLGLPSETEDAAQELARGTWRARDLQGASAALSGGEVPPGQLGLGDAGERMRMAKRSAELLQSPTPGAPAPTPQPAAAGAGTRSTSTGGSGASQTPPAPAAPSSQPPAAPATGPRHPAAPTASEHYGGLQITPQATIIRVGEAVQLRAIDHGGREYAGASWSCSDTRFLNVSTSGTIIGRAAGKATVLARVDDMGAWLDVEVVGPEKTAASPQPQPPAVGTAGTAGQPGATPGSPDSGAQPGVTPGSGTQAGATPGGAAPATATGTTPGAPGAGAQTGSQTGSQAGSTPGSPTQAGATPGAAGGGGQAATTPGTVAGSPGAPGTAATGGNAADGANPASGPGGAGATPGAVADPDAAEASGGDAEAEGDRAGGGAEPLAGLDLLGSDSASPGGNAEETDSAAGMEPLNLPMAGPPATGLDAIGDDPAAPGAEADAESFDPSDFFLDDLPPAEPGQDPPSGSDPAEAAAAGQAGAGSLAATPTPADAGWADSGWDDAPVEVTPQAPAAESQPTGSGGSAGEPAAGGADAGWADAPVEVTVGAGTPSVGGAPGGESPASGAADAGWADSGWADAPVEVTAGAAPPVGGEGASGGGSPASGAADPGWADSGWGDAPVEVTAGAGPPAGGGSAPGGGSPGTAAADPGWADSGWDEAPTEVAGGGGAGSGGANPGGGSADSVSGDSGGGETPVEAPAGSGISMLGLEVAGTISAPPPVSSPPGGTAPPISAGRGGSPRQIIRQLLQPADFAGVGRGIGRERSGWRPPPTGSWCESFMSCATDDPDRCAYMGFERNKQHPTGNTSMTECITLSLVRWKPSELAAAKQSLVDLVNDQRRSNQRNNLGNIRQVHSLGLRDVSYYDTWGAWARVIDGLWEIRVSTSLMTPDGPVNSPAKVRASEAYGRLVRHLSTLAHARLERAIGSSRQPPQAAQAAGPASASGHCWVGCKPAVRPLRCAVACDGNASSAATALSRGGHTDYRLKNASWERCAQRMRELGQSGW